MEMKQPIELNHKIVANKNSDIIFGHPALHPWLTLSMLGALSKVAMNLLGEYKETIDCKGFNLEQIKGIASRYEVSKLTNVNINDGNALNVFNKLPEDFKH